MPTGNKPTKKTNSNKKKKKGIKRFYLIALIIITI